MWEHAVLVASQVAVQLATWPLVAALVLSVARAAPGRRRVLPVAATIALLAGTAVGSVAPDLFVVTGATWWFALPVLLGCYPDGRFVPRWIVAPVAPVALFVAFAVAFVLTAGAVADPWGGVVGFSTLGLLGASVYRYVRRSGPAERESVRWAIFAVLAGVGLFVVQMFVEGGTVAEHGPVSVAVANVIGVVIPVGLALGLLRPRLIDIDRALAGLVGVLLAGAGISAVAAAAWALGAVGGATVAPPVAIAAVALVTVPAVAVARRAASWVVFRGRLDEAGALAELDARLAALPDATDAPAVVVATVADALRLAGVDLRGDAHLMAAAGEVAGDAEEFPVVYQGESVATLRVAPRPGESALTAHDRAVVNRLAQHAAPALYAARSVTELREAHTAILQAREEERRRLRRDLHDDLGPTLSGLGLSAAAVARRARQGEPVADDADRLSADVQAAVAQSREIAYGLRPPILDDLGLLAALRNRIHGATADDLTVRVSGEGLPAELPAALEVAVLRIVQEAVANVRRHAHATRCDVHVAATPDAVVVTVDDDGTGFEAGRRAGLGLASIRDRARELGGSSEFGTAGLGGASVRVRLPIARVAS